MELLIDSKRSVFSQFIENNPKTPNREQFNVYPQMPTDQIHHYIKQSARKESRIIIQFNPSSFSNKFTEISGKIKLSTQSSHIILSPKNKQRIHLIQPQFIRHIRLVG